MTIEKEEEREAIREEIEHRDVLLNINAILEKQPGKDFFEYLFKHLEVGEINIPIGADEDWMRDKLGFLRAGNSIFKLVSEANFLVAGQILAKVKRNEYVYETERRKSEVSGTPTKG